MKSRHMIRRTNLTARTLVLAGVCCCVLVATRSHAAEPAAFPLPGHIAGSEVLLESEPARVVVGEIHGTAEIPRLVAVLVRSFSAKAETVLCLEVSTSEQPRLNAFLASDGGDAATRALLAGQHWLSPDGRASTALFEMLQLARQLAESGRPVRLAAIDVGGSQLLKFAVGNKPLTEEQARELARKRDQLMASNVERVVAKHPTANIVVLVGNMHARVRRGVPWDAEYEPLGWHLKQKLPEVVSLNYQSSGGEAWVMNAKGEAGPRAVRGRDRGDKPFIKLHESTTNAYDGFLYAGHLTASPPANKQASTTRTRQQSQP